MSLATNRQKKLLKFFGVPYSERTTMGGAGWEIQTLLSDEARREQWRKYVYLTSDFDSDSDELKPFNQSDLINTEVPEDWTTKRAVSEFRGELVASLLAEAEQDPFDKPQPEVIFAGKLFVFTGKFEYGTRKACQQAVLDRGGRTGNTASHQNDYLVIGSSGSTHWKYGDYGQKIENAIIARRDYGAPAIISEEHWRTFLEAD